MSNIQSAVKLAKFHLENLLKPGLIMLDATCGNGHDSLFLAQKGLGSNGHLYVFDIQEKAVENTKKLLKESLDDCDNKMIEFHTQCHSIIDQYIDQELDLAIYNLGYLPSGDKSIITDSKTTLLSLEKALKLLKPNGYLFITCYPGHVGGDDETDQVVLWAKKLSSNYIVCKHNWVNRSDKSPILILIQKRN